jgi:hypothetical protein
VTFQNVRLIPLRSATHRGRRDALYGATLSCGAQAEVAVGDHAGRLLEPSLGLLDSIASVLHTRAEQPGQGERRESATDVRLDGDEMAADVNDGDAGHFSGTYMGKARQHGRRRYDQQPAGHEVQPVNSNAATRR